MQMEPPDSPSRSDASSPELRVELCVRAPPPRTCLSFDVGRVNPSWCLLERIGPSPAKGESLNGYFRILHWECVGMGANDTPLKTIVANFVEAMRERPWMVSADRVRVEQQPMMGGVKNAIVCVRNQSISHCVYTYFAALGHADVGYVHPVHKLKVHSEHMGDTVPKGEAKYRDRKAMAVRHAKALLADCEGKWYTWFLRQRKQDDLADALLQGLHCLFIEDPS